MFEQQGERNILWYTCSYFYKSFFLFSENIQSYINGLKTFLVTKNLEVQQNLYLWVPLAKRESVVNWQWK
jgi:hypothetical protein